MPTEPASRRFPLSESLERFFRLDPCARVSLTQVADLLGTTTEAVQALLRHEGVPGRIGTSIPWTQAAAYLFDAWPRAEIFNALSAGAAELIPSQFHLTRVTWSLPIFLVRAMEHQAARAWHTDARVRTTLARLTEDYVADLLYTEIEPATLAAFRHDKAFLHAFHYPVVD